METITETMLTNVAEREILLDIRYYATNSKIYNNKSLAHVLARQHKISKKLAYCMITIFWFDHQNTNQFRNIIPNPRPNLLSDN